MARITIDLEQGLGGPTRREGRRLSFPDGLDRIITLYRREWAMYDELSLHWVYPGLFEDNCFRIASQYGRPGDPVFEQKLVNLISLSIEAGQAVLNEDRYGVANQNDTYAR